MPVTFEDLRALCRVRDAALDELNAVVRGAAAPSGSHTQWGTGEEEEKVRNKYRAASWAFMAAEKKMYEQGGEQTQALWRRLPLGPVHPKWLWGTTLWSAIDGYTALRHDPTVQLTLVLLERNCVRAVLHETEDSGGNIRIDILLSSPEHTDLFQEYVDGVVKQHNQLEGSPGSSVRSEPDE